MFRTDHEPIRYLQSKARLTGRQARWLDLLQSFNFEVQHVAGIQNVVPDALSRRPDYLPSLKVMSLTNPEFGSRLKEAYEMDAWSKAMIQVLTNVGEPEDSSVARQAMNFSYDGSFIPWTGTGEGRVYIP